MSKSNFSEEFKRDAVRQITERGYPVAEVSQRGVSQHSLYEWKKRFSSAAGSQGNDQTEEIRRLKKELVRMTEERDSNHSHWTRTQMPAHDTVEIGCRPSLHGKC